LATIGVGKFLQECIVAGGLRQTWKFCWAELTGLRVLGSNVPPCKVLDPLLHSWRHGGVRGVNKVRDHLEDQQGVLVKFDWVNNTTLGPVLIYYEVQSNFNWGHRVLEGDRGLRLYTPPLLQMGYTLMRRRDMIILALEHLGREDPSLANRLLMRFVRSALYLGRGAGQS